MLLLTRLRPLALAATLLLTLPAVAGTGPTKPAQRPAAAKAAPAARPTTASTAAAPAAPQMVTLTGVVLRPDGQPCPGAAVYLAGAARDLVVTDAQGTFRLPAVPAGRPATVLADYFSLGSCRLTVAAPGSQPLRLTIGQ